MTQNSTSELLTLSELARWAHMPTESVRREIQNGKITPDFVSGRSLLFKKTRIVSLVKTLKRIP